MIEGVFRDGHPRANVTLPGAEDDFNIEFVVDTGFEGDLTLPAKEARRLGERLTDFTDRRLADGSVIFCPVYSIEMDERDEIIEVLILPGEPLMGTNFLKNQHLHIEMTEGGAVYAEELN